MEGRGVVVEEVVLVVDDIVGVWVVGWLVGIVSMWMVVW